MRMKYLEIKSFFSSGTAAGLEGSSVSSSIRMSTGERIGRVRVQPSCESTDDIEGMYSVAVVMHSLVQRRRAALAASDMSMGLVPVLAPTVSSVFSWLSGSGVSF